MSPAKHTPSKNASAEEFKRRVLLCVHKLSDRDTHSAAATELEFIAKNLNHESISPFITSISITDSSEKSPVRKQCVRLISTLSEAHGDVLSPYLSKLISSVVRRLRDPDTAVRTACVAATSSIAAHITKPPFTSVAKPFVDALVTEQDFNSQIGAALCMTSVIKSAPVPDTAYLRRLLPRIEKLLKSDSFKGKSSLLTVVASVISVGAASSTVIVTNLVKIMTDFVSKSQDWSVRKAAAEVLEKLAMVEPALLLEFKASCLKTFEKKKYDKVKGVRETMNQMIDAWNAIPDVPEEVSPPPESNSSEDLFFEINKPAVPYVSSTSTITVRNAPAMFCKLDRKKPNNQKPQTNAVQIKHRYIAHETKRALFGESADEKMHESQNHEDRSSSRVAGISDAHDYEDLSLVCNQLVQIETQQSRLLDLLEKFIGSSLNGMQLLESRVRGIESTLDEISVDLAKSTGRVSNPERTLCCKLPGADLLSSKLWKKTEIHQSNMGHYCPPSSKHKNLESYNRQIAGFRAGGGRSGLIKNPLAEVR